MTDSSHGDKTYDQGYTRSLADGASDAQATGCTLAVLFLAGFIIVASLAFLYSLAYH